MWRKLALLRLNLPLASFLKRFAAPLLVFIFGMTTPCFVGAPLHDKNVVPATPSAGRSLRETLEPGRLLITSAASRVSGANYFCAAAAGAAASAAVASA